MISYQCSILSTLRSGLIISSRLLLCVTFLTCLSSIANATESWNQEAIDKYNRLICEQSNTCDLVHQVPPHLRDLRTRNCMCDDKCALYNDCCPDANESPLKVNKTFICVETPINGHIYMVKSCPNSWNNTSVMKKCVDEKGAASSYDFLLKIPVTGNQSGITYGNVFCAICNEEKKYFFWKIGLNYGKVLPNDTMNSTNQNTENCDGNKLIHNLVFNKTGDSSWSSNVDGSFYWVRFREALPKNATEMVRYCLPNIVQTCPNGSFCGASTSNVYSDNKFYKNANVSGNFETCFKKKNRNNDRKMKYTLIQYLPKDSHCEGIPTDIEAYNLICPCFYKPTKELCHINKYFSMSENEISYIDNRSIFLPKYDMKIPCSQYKVIDDNKDLIFICGTEPLTTRYQLVLGDIDRLATAILMKISIVCIILHLLIFSLVLEVQNLFDKNLTSFCVALLLAFILFEVGLWLPSYKEIAVGLHYCLLSCFTWMLVISYDLWSSLYKASSKFRFASKKHDTKFLIYSAIAWILPLLIVGPAVYIEFSASSFISSDWKPAYGENGVCFIGQADAKFYFFVLPVTLIIFVNICLFFHVAYYIYLSKRKSGNPDTRNNFCMYCKLALLMGFTWILGTAAFISNDWLIFLIFSLSNASQGIFIFCAFTLQRRIVTPQSQQNSQRRLLSRRVSSFFSSAAMRTASTATSESSVDKRNTRMAPV